MLRIFISHASADSMVAKRLYDDLKNTGHEVVVDVVALRMGDDLINFMDKSIAEADVIIIIYSKATKNAKWQSKEVSAALWFEENDGGRVIVLKLDDTDLPPLLGPKVYGSIAEEHYLATFNSLCSALLPGETATTLFSQALAKGSPNPFWRVRAEYFDDEWPKLLAEAYSPPGASKIGILEEMMPCFLEGPRGTGKTMLLLSLRARILAARQNTSKTLSQLFGFYLRLDRGAFCNSGIKVADDADLAKMDGQLLAQLTETFAQEFYLSLTESLVSEVLFCVHSKLVELHPRDQENLVHDIYAAIHGVDNSAPVTLVDLLEHFSEVHRKLSEFVRRRFIYVESFPTPIATLGLDTFKRTIAIVRKRIPAFSDSQFTLLLDEYENLFPYQQVVVNSLVKLGPPNLSVKIARKVGTRQTSQTSIGQDLQEIHDYNQIPLVYTVEEDSECRRYVDLLESIVRNLFASQGIAQQSLSEMLPHDSDLEVDSSSLREEVLRLWKVTEEQFAALPAAEQMEKMTYYREAAIYRLVYGKRGVRGEKRFAGVRQLAFISSGVIRWFQEILGMAYHLEYGLSTVAAKISMRPENQSRAVHIVSNHNLSALGRNIEKYGERLKYLLLDLGDCLRYKLIKHSSEPEAGRIAIINPELLETEKFRELAELLKVGVREGVFQAFDGRPGMRPKHGEPQPVEFNIARIYVPALQFSPRFRWKTPVACSDLRGLIDPDLRKTSKGKLLRKFAAGRRNAAQGELSYGDLSHEEGA